MSPTINALHVWPEDQQFPSPVNSITLEWGGIPGDRHFGETMASNSREKHAFERGTTIRNYRQISIVDSAELATIARNMDLQEIVPGTIADNICIEGIPELTALPLMTRLMFPSGASIMTGGENNPCTIAGTMVGERYGTQPHAFPKAAMHLRGITGWVERPGVINIGDSITIISLH